MPAWLAAAAPAAISGVASLLGGRQAQGAALAESQRNREFQERMRNTAWQAAVEDMRRAGINPAVAYSRGPAASPGGSTASVSDYVTPAVGSALQARMMQAQLKLLDAQIVKATAEAKSADWRSNIDRYDSEFALAKRNYYFDIHGNPKGPLAKLLESEFMQKLATSARDVSLADVARFSIPEQEAIAKLFGQFGEGAKGMQLLGPLILSMLRGRR